MQVASGHDDKPSTFSIQQAGKQRHSNKLGKASCVHFGHYVGAIDFDRSRADAQIKCNDLVGFPATSLCKTSRSRADNEANSIVDIHTLGLTLRILIQLAEGRFYRSKQNFVVKRLFQKIGRPSSWLRRRAGCHRDP